MTPRTTPRRTVLVDKLPKRETDASDLGVVARLDGLGEWEQHLRPLPPTSKPAAKTPEIK